MSTSDQEDLGLFSDWQIDSPRADKEKKMEEASTEQAADSVLPAEVETALDTALHVPLHLLHFSPEELASLPPSLTALLQPPPHTLPPLSITHEQPLLPSLPLCVQTERVRGIAFQLWPAGKVMSQYICELQTDQSIANALQMERGKGKKEEEEEEKVPTTVGPVVPIVPVVAEVMGADAAPGAVLPSPPVSTPPPAPPAPTSFSLLPPLPPSSSFWSGKRVLELGAGCGLVGILAAALGADVTLTDLPAVVQHLQANIDANYGPAAQHTTLPIAEEEWSAAKRILQQRCKVAPLAWGEPLDQQQFGPDKFDVILLADCVYWEELFSLLVSSLRALCRPSTLVFLCQLTRRPKVEKRFFRLAQKHFHVQLVRRVSGVESGEKKELKIYRMQLQDNKKKA